MAKAVAVEGDTKEITSTAKLPADAGQSGAWKAGSLQITTGDTISVDGKKVELSAMMTWTYEGGTAANNSPLPTLMDSATLSAGATKLKDKNRSILVDGDEISGTVDSGNKIVVSVSQGKLTTA